MTFKYRARRQQPGKIARRGLDRDAVADPVDVLRDIAAAAAVGDDFIGPARKESLDHVAPARQQTVRVAALRDALARNVLERKCVALHDRDGVEEVRERPG